jgi:hypothetical protein
MNLARADGYLQNVTPGGLIIAIPLLDSLRHRRAS